jgi:hypothetical protein
LLFRISVPDTCNYGATVFATNPRHVHIKTNPDINRLVVVLLIINRYSMVSVDPNVTTAININIVCVIVLVVVNGIGLIIVPQ